MKPAYWSYVALMLPHVKPNADDKPPYDKLAALGLLTILVSAKSPGKSKESNWLPAPNGPFWTVLRNYGPAPEIINSTYKQPDYVASPL
jgi:Protein of unknown function (DUF1214)